MTDPQYKKTIEELTRAYKNKVDISFQVSDTKDDEQRKLLAADLQTVVSDYHNLLSQAVSLLEEEYELTPELARKIVLNKICEGMLFVQDSCTYEEYEQLLSYKDALGLKLICVIGFSNAKG